MKIYHITEAPRIAPTFGKMPPASNSGPTVSSTATASGPLKGQSLKLNGVSYQFRGAKWIVTDTSEFKGKNPPNKGSFADGNAKELLNQQAAKLNGGGGASKADAPKADTKADADAPKGSTKLGKLGKGAIGTAKAGVRKVVVSAPGAALVSGSVLAFINFLEVKSLLEDYGKALDQANGDVTATPVIYMKQELMRGIIEGTTSVFTAAASGAMTAAAFSRGLAFIPFTGWIASLIVGSISGIAAYVITRLAKDAAFLKSIAEFMMRKIDSKLILQYSEGTNENTAGAENNIKQVMKAAIKSDPKMMAAFKQAKANKAKSTAS
jgi:hypothetical protein